jgi:hypothetical protein
LKFGASNQVHCDLAHEVQVDQWFAADAGVKVPVVLM